MVTRLSTHHLGAKIKRIHTIPRFPIRWRWFLLVGVVVLAAVLLLSLITLDLERNAWLKSQDKHALAQVARLGEALKLPMLSGSQAEVDVLVTGMLKSSPDIIGVLVNDAKNKQKLFGSLDAPTVAEEFEFNPATHDGQTTRLDLEALWYVQQVRYAETSLGFIAVRYSEAAWSDLARQLWVRMLLTALGVILVSGALVYWIAGRMSHPLERLAEAAEQVAAGNLNVKLLEKGNDEITDAMHQFNIMVRELKHKEELRESVGKYLNPKLVDEMFKGGVVMRNNHKQQVTVLFADMVSFTSFSEKNSPEAVVDILNQYFEVFNSIIHYFGGHVDKYIGDAVMAVFNHPNESPKHTHYATLAGLAMTMACARLGLLRDNGEAIAFRVGLNRGEVIVGHIGSHERLEYTVIGDAVNVASRMGGLGQGGEVVMPFKTFETCETGLEFEDMGNINVKGVKFPIRVGKAVAESDDVQQELETAIALAFDITLPSVIRQQLKEVE
ncbi:MAG: adenylate/guanylate cyclase domain-containing protein [Zetaproteobacteria bacterium CG_4_9_14_3_um_filter_49_83]|nr:MAG: adenylate/guanylate cyclase domain-containing protein [Zetaproteobacteria bacterium CG1_02_49_23]PIQ30103.1 MAG: adenylate/guanylate cyclase domain-containing protein [Zetaproteobacteria bacterium CG17_big_fil_post_rev_8_21_14_2_50_50_13]PIV31527.1 MAG: adenylate/guanylate cyclase domain-containing protein [Zetaproteobacteria bacterium CG02_land_8_20_14_3_00_50_9]PIY55949.1 MAG: adenylate/guanylate cyclase domain-containing protein [Zetaproteobacteria bacterium CG_4_10_14_0_8_um_filter_4